MSLELKTCPHGCGKVFRSFTEFMEHPCVTATDGDEGLCDCTKYECKCSVDSLRADLAAARAALDESNRIHFALNDALREMCGDAHYFSGRPCQTCRKLSKAWGKNYGCYSRKGQSEKLVFAKHTDAPSAAEAEGGK
jgi:hypothetical protein